MEHIRAVNQYLLDTNTTSHIIRGDIHAVNQRLAHLPMHTVGISVITQAELLYGVAKCGRPLKLNARVTDFLQRIEIYPRARQVAETYAQLRTNCESHGISLAPLDMAFAAHAQSLAATLVT